MSSLLRYFVPRSARFAEAQADARSLMTGRIVDSYTNIATVKLFSHSQREEAYAHEAMDQFLDTVHRQMRLFTLAQHRHHAAQHACCCSAVAALGIWLWLQGSITPGAIAVATALVLRFQGMSQWVMWEMSQLFENIGTVRDGINSISLPRVVADPPGAKPLGRVKGDIRFDDVSFHYGKTAGVIEDLDLHDQARARRSASSAARAPASRPSSTCCCASTTARAAAISIDGTDIATVHAGFAARADRRGDAGHLAAASLGAREHPLWPPRRDRGGDARSGASWPRPTTSSRGSSTSRAARATTPMSASAA